MNLTSTDIEYCITFLLLIVGLMVGIRKRTSALKAKSLSMLAIDKIWADVIKSISCVFVLMGHWGTRTLDFNISWGISKVVWFTTANIALCWFIFFSGYGLSLKDYSNIKLGQEWWKRAKKIYLPLLLVCACSMIVYAILPDKGLENEWNKFTPYVHMLHSFDRTYFPQIVEGTLGLFDWYVSCILFFYTIFYMAVFLSRMLKTNHTILLAVFMLVYNVVAYFVFGWEQAHYFRFPWIFMLGHVVAVYKNNPKWVNILTLCIFASTIFIHINDIVQLFCFVLSVIGLFIFAFIGRRYTFQGKALLFVGSISYFFYLSHIRIGYTLLGYTGVHSMLLWIVITIIISFALSKIYRTTITS